MRLLIRSLLVSCGLQHVTEASDGEAALEIMRLNPMDLVIADLLMTPMDGLEMTRRLRCERSSLNPLVPVLMISGKMDRASFNAGIDAGVTDFLVKPVSPSNFERRIEAIFEKPRTPVKSQHYYGPDRRRRKVRASAERRACYTALSNVFEV
jgi:two-component system chemotaxis response regulator CheY